MENEQQTKAKNDQVEKKEDKKDEKKKQKRKGVEPITKSDVDHFT